MVKKIDCRYTNEWVFFLLTSNINSLSSENESVAVDGRQILTTDSRPTTWWPTGLPLFRWDDPSASTEDRKSYSYWTPAGNSRTTASRSSAAADVRHHQDRNAAKTARVFLVVEPAAFRSDIIDRTVSDTTTAAGNTLYDNNYYCKNNNYYSLMMSEKKKNCNLY